MVLCIKKLGKEKYERMRLTKIFSRYSNKGQVDHYLPFKLIVAKRLKLFPPHSHVPSLNIKSRLKEKKMFARTLAHLNRSAPSFMMLRYATLKDINFEFTL